MFAASAASVDLSTVGLNIAYLTVPVVGLIVVAIGLRMRARARARARHQSVHYPPGTGGSPLAYAAPAGRLQHGYVMPPQMAGYATGYSGTAHPPFPVAPPAWAPTPPRSRSRRGTIVAVLGAVIFFGATLGEFGYLSYVDAAPTAAIGDCVTRDSMKSFRGPRPVSCAKPNTFEVVSTSQSAECPDGPVSKSLYVSIDQSAHTTWCLVPNLSDGDCFRIDSPEVMFDVIDCADPFAAVKVAERIDGASVEDSRRCPRNTRFIAFPEPERVYCLEVLRSRIRTV